MSTKSSQNGGLAWHLPERLGLLAVEYHTGHDVFDQTISGHGPKATAKVDPRRLRPDASEVLVLESSPAKAKARLGWEPRTSLEQGLDATAAWLRENAAQFRSGFLHV